MWDISARNLSAALCVRILYYTFLSTCLQSSGLKNLTIAFSEFAFGSRSLSKVLSKLHHECLKGLKLTGVTLRFGELRQYLAPVEGPCDVVLKTVESLSGKWAEELDSLRGLSRVSITVVDPFGVEFCETQFRDL